MAVIYVDNGTELVSDALLALVGASVTASGFYVGWGTGGGTSTATNTDVDLAVTGTTTDYARVSATTEDQSAADTNRWIAHITAATATKVINEAGLFINATGTATDLLIRGDFGDITTASGDVIEFTFTLQQT